MTAEIINPMKFRVSQVDETYYEQLVSEYESLTPEERTKFFNAPVGQFSCFAEFLECGFETDFCLNRWKTFWKGKKLEWEP
jgi:hypothetical protein